MPVGLEPVAVAARTNGEVWVVNHLSDSVSIVDVAAAPPRVTRTLLVGDEPRDIVFAGPSRSRAFITAAHRGQNVPFNPQLTTAGVGRADVWVFDSTNLGASLGGTPLTIVTLFGDTPRALAASTDGNTAIAAVFHSGNRTTTVHANAVCDGGAGAAPCSVGGVTFPGGLPSAPGWRLNGAGTKWTFKDSSGALAGGISKVIVSDRTANAPGLYRFTIVGKTSDFQVAAGEVPVSLLVVFGSAPGQCATIAFNSDGGPAAELPTVRQRLVADLQVTLECGSLLAQGVECRGNALHAAPAALRAAPGTEAGATCACHAEPRQRRSGRWRMPVCRLLRVHSTPPASAYCANTASSSSKTTRISSRARFPPRQKWTP